MAAPRKHVKRMHSLAELRGDMKRTLGKRKRTNRAPDIKAPHCMRARQPCDKIATGLHTIYTGYYQKQLPLEKKMNNKEGYNPDTAKRFGVTTGVKGAVSELPPEQGVRRFKAHPTLVLNNKSKVEKIRVSVVNTRPSDKD